MTPSKGMQLNEVEATGTFVKDTAKGKKHFSVEGDGLAGAIYLTPEKFKELGVKGTITVVVTPG